MPAAANPSHPIVNLMRRSYSAHTWEFAAKEMRMKRTFFLGLACSLLHAGMSLGQDTKAVPDSAPPPVPVMIQDAGTPPAAGFFDGGGFGSRPAGPRVWADAEYLMWWVKSGPQPLPLVATAAGAPVLGQPGTTVLYGPSIFEYGMVSGGRATLGYWFDSEQTFGIEGRGFLLQQRSVTGFSIHSDANGNPRFNVPFFDLGAVPPGESGFLESSGNGGPRTGSFSVNSSTSLWGAEANGIWNVYRGNSFRLGALAGFRYLDLQEQETLLLSRTDMNGVPFQGTIFGPGNAIGSVDSFSTRNQFYGGQLGLRATYTAGRWFAEVDAKAALGDTLRTIDVTGNSSLTMTNGAVLTAPGGLFAGPSRVGTFTSNTFGVIPEGEFKLGYQFTQRISAFVGYNFLYWNDVVRPGNQVNRNINTNEIATSFNYNPAIVVPREPQSFNGSAFWAQGVNFGLQFKF
jgi:hypothetical protein